MKRSKFILLTAAVVAVLAMASIWWHADRARQRVAALLPPPPDLQSSPPAMRAAHDAASARVRRTFGSQAGLAGLARFYHANGFLAEALRCYEALEIIDPTQAQWPHLAATIVAGYGDLDAAIPLWQKVVRLQPDYLPAHLRLGDCLLKSNRLPEAAAAYEGALKLEHDNPYAQLGLARIDLESGRLDSARTRLEDVVNKTSYALGYDLIVSLYERLGLTRRALSVRGMAKASGAYRDPADPWLDSLIDVCLDPYRLSLVAGNAARNGDAKQALALLRRATDVAPEDVAVHFQLGTLLVAQGQLDEAQNELERCTVLAPDFADGWAHLSSLQARQGRVSEADRTLQEGLRRCPDSPGLHLMMARHQQQAGRLGEAIVEYQASIRLRPNEADAYIELGNLYAANGRDGDAVREMARALAAEPGNPVALGVLAFNAVNSGSETEAREWLARVRNQPRVESDQVNRLVGAFEKRFGRKP